MKKYLTAAVCLFGFSVSAQNIGIGTTIPQTKLHVSAADTASVRIENTTTLNTGVSNGLYFKTGSWFTGAIKNTGTGTNVSRTGFFGFASLATTGLKEYMSILDNGNVGIGTTTPAGKLDVNGPVNITGVLKIADATQGAGKVLTSDISGNASWQKTAFANTERFSFGNYVSLGSAALVINYNTGTATATDATTSISDSRQTDIHFTKTGLYHFDINAHLAVVSSFTTGTFNFDITDNNGRHYIYSNDTPLFGAGTNDVRGSYDKEIDIYIDQAETLHFSNYIYNGGHTFTLNSMNQNISGYLIAD